MSDEYDGPSFDFTTILVHGKVNNMHDDTFVHRARPEYESDGSALVTCSCGTRWAVPIAKATALGIQVSFDAHLKEGTNALHRDRSR